MDDREVRFQGTEATETTKLTHGDVDDGEMSARQREINILLPARVGIESPRRTYRSRRAPGWINFLRH